MQTKFNSFSRSFWSRAAGVTMITMLLLAAAPITSAFASTALGYFAPTTVSAPGNGWKSSANVKVADGLYTTAAKGNKNLVLGGFGITALSSAVTINGIEVSVKGKTTGYQSKVSLSYNAGSTYTTGAGVKTTTLTGTDSTLVLGGPTDTWGRTWSATELTSTRLKVKLNTTGSSGIISVDQVQVKIYYTAANTSVSLAGVSGNYGGTAAMTATLTQSGSGAGISGQTITFSLNGTSVGTATTDGAGVATLASASLAGIASGDYPAGASASFAGNGSFVANTITADLRVIGTTTVLIVGPASGTYTGDAGSGTVNLSATLTENGTPLSGKTIDFTLGGLSEGSATTNASGIATISDAGLAGYDAGTYTDEIAASFAGSSSDDMSDGSADLTVTPVVLTVSSTGLTPANKVYDAGTSATLTIGSPTLVGMISPDDVTLDITAAASAFADANVGTGKTVQISGLALAGLDAANYTLTQPTRLANITTRAITVAADAQSKTYGDGDPTLSYAITSGSLAGSDSLSGSLTRTAGENVNTYAIAQGSLSAGSNYTINFTGADLTISAKAIDVTADGQTKTYGDADPALTYTAGALVGSDSFTGTLTRDAGEDVGSYAITQGSLTAGGNYTLNFTGASLSVTKAMLSVTADNQSINVGDPDPAFTFSSIGFIGSDDETVIDTQPICGVVGAHTAAGLYAIACSGGLDNNYHFSYVDGQLSINSVNHPTLTATYRSIGGSDGWVLESSETSNKGGSLNAKATTFNLGDDASRRQYRGILSFNTASLPDNAIITKITLKIRGAGAVGSNPFKTFGQLLVDIRKPFFGLKPALGLDDFLAAPSKKNAGVVLSTPAAGKWYSANIGATAFASLNKAGTTQFRLRFLKDDNNNSVANFMKFYSGNAPVASQPVLIIQYHLP